MSRKTFTRLVVIIVLAASSVFYMVSTINHEVQAEADSPQQEPRGPRKMQGEFIIWEAMGHTVLSASGY